MYLFNTYSMAKLIHIPVVYIYIYIYILLRRHEVGTSTEDTPSKIDILIDQSFR